MAKSYSKSIGTLGFSSRDFFVLLLPSRYIEKTLCKT